MVYLYILAILEHIFRIALQSVNIHILAEHERISTLMQCHVPDLQSLNAPESLISIIDGYVLQFQVPHLPEELRAVDDAILHLHIITIPDGRP